MDAIERLMNEHRTIEQVLDALVAFAGDVRRREATEREELGRFVAFLREFADAAHHAKEEQVLFRVMTEHGFPVNGGPIAVMLHEHVRGRAFVGVLADAASAPGPWTAADRQRVFDAAAGYSDLLHAHIHKEDAVLYPMAGQHLPPDALEAVDAECAAIDAHPARAADTERHLALAASLVAAHAPAVHPGAPPRAPASCCG